MDCRLTFEKYCKKKGMRYTPERDLILREIACLEGHFDIDSLFLNIRNKHPGIKLAKGSVYRVLPHLLAAGIIRESLTQKGHVCYEKSAGYIPHGHLKCIGCGRILEFSDPRVSRIQEDVCKEYYFEMSSLVYVIKGYCLSCRKKNTAIDRVFTEKESVSNE
jgi:Fur family transcriptional regulator, ferric uptake regulator